MTDEITPVGDTHRMPKLYESVLPNLGRLLLSQHLPSVDDKIITVDEFAAVVEKAKSHIYSKKVFLQLQLLRPDYVQFLIDREAWETFCKYSIVYLMYSKEIRLTIINYRRNPSPEGQSKLQTLSKRRSSN